MIKDAPPGERLGKGASLKTDGKLNHCKQILRQQSIWLFAQKYLCVEASQRK